MKTSFKGKVRGASERKAKEAFSYGYLKLPSGVSVFLPIPGKTVTLDFLPYEVTMKRHPDKFADEGIAVAGSLWYRLPFKAHRNIGSKNDSVVCLQTFGKPCPICEYKAKRGKEGADKEELNALKSSDRYLYVVNPLDSDKCEKGKLHVFDISHAMFQKLLDDELKEESVPEDFMDIADGVSLKIRFAEKTIGKSKPFAEATKITVVERAKPYKESILDKSPKLDELLVVMSYDELEAKFFEVDTESEEDEDEDEKPVKKVKKAPVEDDDDEEEDAEPAPVRKKKTVPTSTPKKKVVEEDDEENEEEIDEDGTDYTWEEISKMKQADLEAVCDEKSLDTDADDYEDDIKSFRKAVAKELGIKIPKTVPTPEPITKKDRCVACNGTGKNSKGGICKVCMGTGKKQANPDTDDEDDADDLPFKKGKATAPVKKGAANECPSGYVFGKDVDKNEECDTCDLWDECNAAKKKK